MVVLKTERLGKTYRQGFWRKKVPVLHDLNLEVDRGEIFGYLGPNGAGKTTTIKILMGLVFPDTGEAQILGGHIHDPAIKSRVGFLPENPYFYDYLTGRELLDFYGRLFGLPRAVRQDRIAELLRQVGMEGRADQPLRKFSKGMVQRIGLAQALLNDPELVILDEPMSGLDPLGRHEVRDLILRLKERGKTVFFSTHIIPDVELICDRVAILIGGRLVRSGQLDDLLGSRIESIDVVASGCPEGLRGEAGPLCIQPPADQGSRFVFTVKDEGTLASLLKLLVGSGARVHAVTPRKQSLEEHFIAQMGEGREPRE
ncbi:MAG: ABC transporter ATP-binding protein [Dehalococcoidia bacterium]